MASNNASVSGTTLTQDWDLDPVGNWDGFNQSVSGTLNQTRTFNRVNEITDITNAGGQPVWIDPVYDDAGNTTLTPLPAAPTTGFTLVYDAWNFPVEVKTSGAFPKAVAKYAYNGLRHRIRKAVYDSAGALSNTVLFFNNLGWQCLESRETPVVGSPATTTYVWGVRYIDDLICRDRGSERLYTMQDRQYKTMAIANASGAVQERYGYTPYGVTTVYSPTYSVRSGSSFDWTYLYTGRELDWETHLYYFRNRMYDPVLGRFLTRDPIGYRGGVSLYRYVAGRPTAMVDPSGTEIVLGPIFETPPSVFPELPETFFPPGEELSFGIPYESPFLTPDQNAAFAACAGMNNSSYASCSGCTRDKCEEAASNFIQAVNDSWLISIPLVGPLGPNTCSRKAEDILKRIPGIEDNPCVSSASMKVVQEFAYGGLTQTHAYAEMRLCNNTSINGDNGAYGGDDQIWVGPRN